MDIYFNDIAAWTAFWIFIAVAVGAGIVIMLFFLLNLRNLLNQVSPQNRAMQPNHVWLNFIPIFSLVWMIITVVKVRDSVRAEYQSRGWAPQGDFGYGVGMAFAICSILQLLLSFVGFVSLVCWIIYWVKTAELKNQLRVAQPPGGWSAPTAPPPAPYVTPPPPVQGETQVKVETSSGGNDTTPAPTSGTTTGQSVEASGEPQVVCPVCGVENRPNAKFCRSCGRSF